MYWSMLLQSGRGPAPLSFGNEMGIDVGEYRSPRTPKPNQRWSREDATGGIHPIMKPFQKILTKMASHKVRGSPCLDRAAVPMVSQGAGAGCLELCGAH
jgi:hypothetical protein